MKKDGLITVLILVGLVGGAVLGQILHGAVPDPVETGNSWMSVGKIVLVRPLMLLVLPLMALILACTLLKLVAWYQVEWPYARRLVELLLHMQAVDHGVVADGLL